MLKLFIKSELFAEKAEYINSKNYLQLSDNVILDDQRELCC